MSESGSGTAWAAMLGVEVMNAAELQAPTAPTFDAGIAQFRAPGQQDIEPHGERFLEADAYSLGLQAVVYGYATVPLYRLLIERTQDTASPQFLGFNRFRHGRRPATPTDRAVAMPEVDILRSEAWLDLSQEPLVFTVPDTGGRAYSASFQDLFGNASNIGRRTYGTGAGRFALVPPGWRGTLAEELTPFRVSTRYLRVLLRLPIEAGEDLTAVRALQDRFSFLPLGAYCGAQAALERPLPSAPPLGQPLPPLEFYRLLADALQAGGLPEGDEGLVASFARFGLRLDRSFDSETVSAATRRGLIRAYDDAVSMIEGSADRIGQDVNGWSRADLAMYGRNYLYRAAAALQALDANVKEECLAFTAFADQKGTPLDASRCNYLVRFAAGALPPVDAFWSIALYDGTTEGLVENALKRYAVGDRTPALSFGTDGSLEIRIQSAPPPNAAAANWLPAPVGPFCLRLRAYQPRARMLTGEWSPPAVFPFARES